MKVITTAELSVLAKELQDLIGFYIDRFYEVSEGRFRIKLSKSKVQCNLQIILSHTINKTSYIEKQDQPTGFAMAARKRIEGFQIRDIKQLNNDRIMLFVLKKGETELNLVAEMFGRGNLVITDNAMKILLAYRQQEMKDRVIKRNMEYVTPKQSGSYRADIPESIIPSGYKTLQEALDEYYHENPVNAQNGENPGQKRLAEELQNSIKKQEKILDRIDVEIAGSKELGNALFNNMALVNELVKAAQANKRITKEELQKMFPTIRILNVDLKDKRLTVELSK